MKNINIVIALIAIFTVWGIPNTVSGQEAVEAIKYDGHSTKFAFLINNTHHFKGVIATAEKMDVKGNNFSFEIVIVGELVKELIENKDLVKLINKSQKMGVKIVVCEGALSRFNIPKSKLDERLLTTRNGWIYMFELKDKGFNTLSL